MNNSCKDNIITVLKQTIYLLYLFKHFLLSKKTKTDIKNVVYQLEMYGNNMEINSTIFDVCNLCIKNKKHWFSKYIEDFNDIHNTFINEYFYLVVSDEISDEENEIISEEMLDNIEYIINTYGKRFPFKIPNEPHFPKINMRVEQQDKKRKRSSGGNRKSKMMKIDYLINK